MYNPSRGGVRGGADQFTWEGVKNNKHRENYLGHSLMAPVGRWQKGKDLSWYAKQRKDDSGPPKSDKSELASIKKAEEEAMLIALGHNVVRKTTALSKEDIREALKRNTGEKDEYDIERVDGVGASSQRVALLSGVGKNSKHQSEGVVFESRKEQKTNVMDKSERMDELLDNERRRSKKKAKKHKKEKKHKKHCNETRDSDLSNTISKHKIRHEKGKSESYSRNSLEVRRHRTFKHQSRDSSSEDYEHFAYQENKKRLRKEKDSLKRHRHDTSESD